MEDNQSQSTKKEAKNNATRKLLKESQTSPTNQTQTIGFCFPVAGVKLAVIIIIPLKIVRDNTIGIVTDL